MHGPSRLPETEVQSGPSIGSRGLRMIMFIKRNKRLEKRFVCAIITGTTTTQCVPVKIMWPCGITGADPDPAWREAETSSHAQFRPFSSLFLWSERGQILSGSRGLWRDCRRSTLGIQTWLSRNGFRPKICRR